MGTTYTAQEIFDRVTSHIAAQGFRAAASMEADDSQMCLYRDAFSGRCAAGCLIEDRDYRPIMERKTVSQLEDRGLLPSYLRRHKLIVGRLQNVHDEQGNWCQAIMVKALQDVASEFDLDASILNRLDFGTIVPSRLAPPLAGDCVMAILPIPATREEWLNKRKYYVGASEVAALLGVGAEYSLSPLALYYAKRGEIKMPDIGNERIDAGNFLEDGICKWACANEGFELLPGVFATDDQCEGSSATLDRVVMPSADWVARGYVGPGALEAKNVAFDAYRDKWIGDEPPPWILIQLQDQLACTGYQWGAVTACIAGNEYYLKAYHRHEPLIEQIRRAKRDFWAMVKAGTPPAADRFESTEIALKLLYPKPRMPLLDMSQNNELPELFDRATTLAEQRKAIIKDEDEAKNRIRQLLGPHESARLADGRIISRTVGEDTPPRPAQPGEMIGGRKGQDRLWFKNPPTAKNSNTKKGSKAA